MKKYLPVLVLLIALWGCSNDNKLTIKNIGDEPIYINFRASIDSVYPGGSFPVTDIPNGTYEYNTTYRIPPGVTSASMSGEAGSGQLFFEKKDTQILLLYSSTLLNGAYTVYVNKSSSEPVSTASPTSTQ